jgi:hypothetical protein
MGSQMAAAYIGIMFIPPIFGVIAQNITPDVFPYYLAVFYFLMMAAMVLLLRGLAAESSKI